MFALQDLATSWTERVKSRLTEAQRADTVTEHIHQVRRVQGPRFFYPAGHLSLTLFALTWNELGGTVFVDIPSSN